MLRSLLEGSGNLGEEIVQGGPGLAAPQRPEAVLGATGRAEPSQLGYHTGQKKEKILTHYCKIQIIIGILFNHEIILVRNHSYILLFI